MALIVVLLVSLSAQVEAEPSTKYQWHSLPGGAFEVQLPADIKSVEHEEETLRASFGPGGRCRFELTVHDLSEKQGPEDLASRFVLDFAKKNNAKTINLSGRTMLIESPRDIDEGGETRRYLHFQVGFGKTLGVASLSSPVPAPEDVKRFFSDSLQQALLSQRKRNPEERSQLASVINVSDDDARMNAAISEARETVKEFIEALRSPRRGRQGFAIKKPFTDGEFTEHIWLAPVKFENGRLIGVVNNVPADVKNVTMGDKVQIRPPEISDWMYIEDGRLVGGYTIRALRAGLSGPERRQFDESLPFELD